MGMPVYVVNFNELAEGISAGSVDVQIDTTEVEELLGKYFPEIIALLEKLAGGGVSGVQKIEGLASAGGEMVFTPQKNIAITGLTFSQSDFDGGGMDKWTLKMRNDSEEITIFNGVYAKDGLQHKYFERFYPVPMGYEVVVAVHNQSGGNKTYWCDLEYLELN